MKIDRRAGRELSQSELREGKISTLKTRNKDIKREKTHWEEGKSWILNMEHKSPQTSVCQKQLLIFISNMEHSQRFLETCKNSTKELANFSTKWILNMEHRSLKTSVFQNQLLIFVSNMEHS